MKALTNLVANVGDDDIERRNEHATVIEQLSQGQMRLRNLPTTLPHNTGIFQDALQSPRRRGKGGVRSGLQPTAVDAASQLKGASLSNRDSSPGSAKAWHSLRLRRRRLTTVGWAFDWQVYKDGNPILDVTSRQHECRLLLNVRSLNCRWVLDPPMGAYRLTHPDRARFTSGVVTKGKNEIHRVCVWAGGFLPASSASVRSSSPGFSSSLSGERIGDAHGVSARR